MERRPFSSHARQPQLEPPAQTVRRGDPLRPAPASGLAKCLPGAVGAAGRSALSAIADPLGKLMVRGGSQTCVKGDETLTELHRPEFSFVIPLFNTGHGLLHLFAAFESLTIPESWELVLVDDGSADDTATHVEQLMSRLKAPVTLVELARNYGEHAAVLEGLRRSRGDWVICLDDDLQNPVHEAVRMLRHLRQSGAEVVYSRYDKKQHRWWRNLGSRFVNQLASWLLGKPPELYLSSFRALRRSLVERIITHRGPYPYIDGLILGATDQIVQLRVEHAPRAAGRSGYTVRKLVRLTLSVLFDFSVMPLRLASVLGGSLCAVGLLVLGAVMMETLWLGKTPAGWASLMGALAVFSGAQLLMLGIIGEYLGRAFLTVSGKPQSLVRAVLKHEGVTS